MQKELADALLPIRSRFLSRLEVQLCEFDQVMVEIDNGYDCHEAFTKIGAGAHKVAGLAQTVGFPELGMAANAVDELIFRLSQEASDKNSLREVYDAVEKFLDLCDAAISSQPK